ncbi:hypothetical protein MMC14_009754, partial [Varicellaria rhodocarpa]|nr:hypothetical protein [Varicellaria rhodocarpa]
MEVVKHTMKEKKDATWSFSINESGKGSDFEVRYKTRTINHPDTAVSATMYFQAKVMQHPSGGQYVNFLYESGGKVINLQSELLAKWLADKERAGRPANAYYIIYDDKDILYANAGKVYAWMKNNIQDTTNIKKQSIKQWNIDMTTALAKDGIDAADAADAVQ